MLIIFCPWCGKELHIEDPYPMKEVCEYCDNYYILRENFDTGWYMWYIEKLEDEI